jgi:hypothetical protein
MIPFLMLLAAGVCGGWGLMGVYRAGKRQGSRQGFYAGRKAAVRHLKHKRFRSR